MDNELSALIKVMLDYSNISGDMSKMQKVLEKYAINITTEVDTAKTVRSIKKVLPQIISELRKIPGVDIPIDMKFSDHLIRESLDQVILDSKKVENELSAIARRSKDIRFSKDNGHGVREYQNHIDSLMNDLQRYGGAVKKAEQETNSLQQTLHKMNGLSGQPLADNGEEFEQEFEVVETLFKEAKGFFDRLSQPASESEASSLPGLLVSRAKAAISELKEVDTLLTEIGKTNDKLSKSDLAEIGNHSFEVASKYGKTATDYLSGIQDASRAGYENAEGIAELSIAAQEAGDMTADLANQYIMATDKAYKLNGSVEALTQTLDGANHIADRNAVNMTELAEAMSIVGTLAASSQMEVKEATAATATLIAVTEQSGFEMGNALKGILMNLRQVTGEIDGEEIDTESLAKYEKACDALGVSLSEVRDDVVQLKKPMQILKELSEEYRKLDESDARRANLLSAVGGNDRANALNAILENYSLYEKMLKDYADGTGFMAREAEETADSWEGSLNRLSNTWTDTVGNVVNSDAIVSTINGLNELLSVVNAITDALGPWVSLGLGAGGFGIAKFVKNLPYQKVLKIA